jgi:hypothetical protein
VGTGSLGGKAKGTTRRKSRKFSAERQMATVDHPEGVSRKKVRSARDPSERKAMIEPGHEELEFTPAGDAVGHQPQPVGPAVAPGAGHVGGGPEGPTGVGPVAQGDNFSVSSATCFSQSGKGSAFSRVVDLDPIILFRSGSFGINDFTFVAEIA